MGRVSVKIRSIMSAVLLGVIGLVVVAGCGGGGSSSSSGESSTGSGGSSGSTSFASGAEAACSSADKQITALGTPQQAEVLDYLEKTEDVIEKLHEEVMEMGASGSAETAYVEALGKSVIVLNHMANAARNENFDAVREISDELIEFKVGELAEEAELKACAEVPGATA
jgi:hypothetical protein